MTVNERWTEVLGVDCPNCGAVPGQACKRSEFGYMGHCVGRYTALDAAVSAPCDAEELTLP